MHRAKSPGRRSLPTISSCRGCCGPNCSGARIPTPGSCRSTRSSACTARGGGGAHRRRPPDPLRHSPGQPGRARALPRGGPVHRRPGRGGRGGGRGDGAGGLRPDRGRPTSRCRSCRRWTTRRRCRRRSSTSTPTRAICTSWSTCSSAIWTRDSQRPTWCGRTSSSTRGTPTSRWSSTPASRRPRPTAG